MVLKTLEGPLDCKEISPGCSLEGLMLKLKLVMIQVSLQNKDKTNGYIFPSTDTSYYKCSVRLGVECKTDLRSCLYMGVVDFTSLNTRKIVI